jgi:PPOX class probable F420-dependent enzyme
VKLSEAAVERLLERWPVARLATLGRDGAPSLVPVVFAASGGRLWIPVDAKPKLAGELARVANVRRDPRVALLLDRYEADWAALWWLRVDGAGAVVEGERAPGVAEAAAALRRKYPQYEETPLFRDAEPTLLAIEPRRITSWAASLRAAGEAGTFVNLSTSEAVGGNDRTT